MTTPSASNYREIGDTTEDVWRAELARLGSPWKDRAASLRAAASPHSALCLAMGVVENHWGATGIIIKPSDNNPLSLRPWKEDPRGAPPGSRGVITAPNGGTFLRFDTPEDCIREWKRRLFDDPAYKGGVYTGATTIEEMTNIYCPPGDVHPITGVDSPEIGYARTVKRLLGTYAANERPTRQEHTAMGMKAYRFVGLDRDVYLPDDIRVTIDIVPDRLIGWVRSGQHFTGQTKTTFHDTGAAGQNARAQRNYLHNGPSEGGKRRLVGFNFAVDDEEIIQLTPLDEVTWAAGTPEGNKTSWHVEQCFGPGIDWDRSLRNAIALHAGLIAAKGWSVDTALVKHQSWYGKWCPGQVLNKGLWPSVVSQVSQAASQLGQTVKDVVTTITYEKPRPIEELEPYHRGASDEGPAFVRAADGTPFFFVSDRVRATRATPRLQMAHSDAKRVGPDLKPGEEFDVQWIFVSDDGEPYYVTPYYTRIKAADTERVSDRRGAAVAADTPGQG